MADPWYKVITGAVKTGTDLTAEGYKKVRDTLAFAVPLTTLAAAYMVARLTSPGGVSENVTDMMINSNARDNLALSLNDLRKLVSKKRRKELGNTANIHDQFV